MAIIKSALELALERTKDIAVDKEGLEAQKFRESGMKLLAKAESESNFDLKAELGRYKGKEITWIHEGLRLVIVGYLSLPAGQDAIDRLDRVVPLLVNVASKPKEMEKLLQELVGYFSQYIQQKDQMVQAVRQQLEASLRQKEEALYQQTGRRQRLTVESDPEFAKYLTMNLDKLQKQYQSAIEPVRENILAQLA